MSSSFFDVLKPWGTEGSFIHNSGLVMEVQLNPLRCGVD